MREKYHTGGVPHFRHPIYTEGIPLTIRQGVGWLKGDQKNSSRKLQLYWSPTEESEFGLLAFKAARNWGWGAVLESQRKGTFKNYVCRQTLPNLANSNCPISGQDKKHLRGKQLKAWKNIVEIIVATHPKGGLQFKSQQNTEVL